METREALHNCSIGKVFLWRHALVQNADHHYQLIRRKIIDNMAFVGKTQITVTQFGAWLAKRWSGREQAKGLL